MYVKQPVKKKTFYPILTNFNEIFFIFLHKNMENSLQKLYNKFKKRKERVHYETKQHDSNDLSRWTRQPSSCSHE